MTKHNQLHFMPEHTVGQQDGLSLFIECVMKRYLYFLFIDYTIHSLYCMCVFVPLEQDISWTRTAHVYRIVHLALLQTLRLSCARTALLTARPVQTAVITASAAPKAAINSFCTRGGAGPTAQSKF